MDHFVGRTNSQPNFLRHPQLSQSSSVTPREDWNSQPTSPVVDAQHIAGELHKHQHRHHAGKHLQNISRRGSMSGNEHGVHNSGRSQTLAARELLASLAGLGPAATQLLLRQPRKTAASCSGAASPACLSARQSQTHSGWQSPVQQSSQNNLVVESTSGVGSPDTVTPSRTFSRQASREMKRSSSASGTLDDLIPGAGKPPGSSQIANIKRVIAQARQSSSGVVTNHEQSLCNGISSNGLHVSGRKQVGVGNNVPTPPQQPSHGATARPQALGPPQVESLDTSKPPSRRPISTVPTIVEGPPVPAFNSPLMQIAAGIRAVNNHQFSRRRPTTAQPVQRYPVSAAPVTQADTRTYQEQNPTGSPQPKQQALMTHKSSALLPSTALPLQPSTPGKLNKVTQDGVVHSSPVRSTTVATLQPRPPAEKPPPRPTSEAGHATAAGSWSPVLGRRNLAADEMSTKGRFSLPGTVRQASQGISAQTSPRSSLGHAMDNTSSPNSPTTAAQIASNANAMCLSACNSVMSIENSATLDRASSQDGGNHNPSDNCTKPEWMGSPVTQKPRFRSLPQQLPNQALLALRQQSRELPSDRNRSPSAEQKPLGTPQGSFVFQPNINPMNSSTSPLKEQYSPEKPDMKRGHTSPLILTSDSVGDKATASPTAKNDESVTSMLASGHNSPSAPGPLRGWAGRACQRSSPGASSSYGSVSPNPLQPTQELRTSSPGIDVSQQALSKRGTGSPVSKLPLTAGKQAHMPGSIYQSYQRQMEEPVSQEVQASSPVRVKPADDPVAKQAGDKAGLPGPGGGVGGGGNLIASKVAVLKEKGVAGTDKTNDIQNTKHVPHCKLS